MKVLNYEVLKELYAIHSPSGGEKRMRRYIKSYIGRNVPSAAVRQDALGNLYVTKGAADSYPCLCAHMDQVQRLHPKDFTCIDADGVIFGYSPKMRAQCGLGADDKNGIFIALSCLEEYDVLKCAFFVGEEIGCVGSSGADAEFFSDCRYCIQIDRRGSSDMVTRISMDALCSDDFVAATDCEAWGYATCHGFMTDVEALRELGVTASCVNLSCGYYEPHTDHEFTVKADLEKCHAFVCHILDTCLSGYPFAYSEEVFEKDPFYYNWKYDECLDVCTDLLENDPSLTFANIKDMVHDSYPMLSEKSMKEIYRIAMSFAS